MAIDWDRPEEWRPIPGSPGYEVSSLGRVRSPWRVLSPWVGNKVGHLKVTLGGGRRMWVHRAVCLAFYGPCPDGLEVRHLDGIASNNVVTNLKYGTHSENMHDRVRHGRQTEIYRGPRTHCPQGHEYNDNNTRINSNGRKECRSCRAEWKSEYAKRQTGVTVACSECGSLVSKLNLNRHKRTALCARRAA